MAIEEEVEDIIQEAEDDTIVEVIDLSGIEDILEALDETARVPEVQREGQDLPRDLGADLDDPTDLPDLQGPLHLGLHLHIANLLSLPKDVGHQKSKQRKLRQPLCKIAL